MSKGSTISVILSLFCLGTIVVINTFYTKGAMSEIKADNANTDSIVLGAGCFWCIEAVLEGFSGVNSVESGYAGGRIPDPTYEQVSSGTSGHAEVVNVIFDPKKITVDELLEVFFSAHDPTTLNRQGNDVGPQYRSAIYYHNDEQKVSALRVKAQVERDKIWSNPIVTEIAPLEHFYPAENYHQNYFKNHPNQPYCSIVIAPKVQKIYKKFASKLKKN